MSDLALAGVAYAEANWGEWKARCVRPDCTNAMALDRGQTSVTCSIGIDACGMVADVVWPPDPDAIEELLGMRPVRRTQNWLPGESLENLIAENAEHDVFPAEWASVAAGEVRVLADIVDQRVVGGILYQQLEAARRREIGA